MRKTKTIKELMTEIHQINVEHGFWETDANGDKVVNIPERLMLTVSELSEALEADRKDKFASEVDFTEKNLINNGSFAPTFKFYVKDTFEDELADAVIRIFDLAEAMKIDLQKHIELKMAYNNLREFKHGKRY